MKNRHTPQKSITPHVIAIRDKDEVWREHRRALDFITELVGKDRAQYVLNYYTCRSNFRLQTVKIFNVLYVTPEAEAEFIQGFNVLRRK